MKSWRSKQNQQRLEDLDKSEQITQEIQVFLRVKKERTIVELCNTMITYQTRKTSRAWTLRASWGMPQFSTSKAKDKVQKVLQSCQKVYRKVMPLRKDVTPDNIILRMLIRNCTRQQNNHLCIHMLVLL